MRIKPAEVVSACGVIGWFMTQLFAKDPRLKTMLKWLFGIMFVGAAIATIWPSTEEPKIVDNHNQTASTSGNNSPAMNAATTSSNSPIYQAGGNITVNNGISVEALHQLLKAKAADDAVLLAEEYANGYTLFGIANGEVVFEPHYSGIKANWGRISILVDRANKIAQITIESAKWIMLNGSVVDVENMQEEFPYVENKSIRLRSFCCPDLYVEVLDEEKGIFLLGWKPKEAARHSP